MHYKNGREAKVGDMIIARDYSGVPTSGVVIKTLPDTTTCNVVVTPVTQQCYFTAGECLHIEDAMDPAKVRQESPSHQQRVMDEKAELDGRLTKLHAFIETSAVFAGLPDAERERLVRQRSCMTEYSEILGERIAAFPPPAA